MHKINETISNISPVSAELSLKAEEKLNALAMPPGALGDIHTLCRQLCAIYGTLQPKIDRSILVLSAADHGIAEQNVSHYPQITDAIVRTALNDGAAINSFCRQADCQLVIVNAGMLRSPGANGQFPYINKAISQGTADMTKGPAMTEEQAIAAINNGIDIAEKLVDDCDIVALGEMGIANTSVATAIFAAISGRKVSDITGAGTGVSGSALENKIAMIEKSLRINQLSDASFPMEILHKVGGFEIAVMTGIILGFSSRKKAIILDGFITTSAALIAEKMAPACKDYLIAGHLSGEKAHEFMLADLQLKPLLQLNMRLGEGIGAALSLNIIKSASDILQNMLTLDEALALK